MTIPAADAAIGPAEFADAFAALLDGRVAERDAPLLLAVSGGPDSTALMHAARRWSLGVPGIALAVATVDHALRPGSRDEAEAVADQARALGLPHSTLTWHQLEGRPPGIPEFPGRDGPGWSAPPSPSRGRPGRRYRVRPSAGPTTGSTLPGVGVVQDETCVVPSAPAPPGSASGGVRPLREGEGKAHAAACDWLFREGEESHAPKPEATSVSQEAARDARYGLLARHAREIGAPTLLTAHTLDDQAETMLIRMAAGSGLGGLAGMAARTCRLGLIHHRPFLRFPKARLTATCLREGWSFVQDPSNRDERYARSRWRRLMPALAVEGLSALRLARLADRLRRADAALDHAADAALVRSAMDGAAGAALAFRVLAAEPTEIVQRVLARTIDLTTSGTALRLDRLEACAAALIEAARNGRALRRTLAGQVLALHRNGTLRLSPEAPRSRGRARPLTVSAVETPHSLGIRDTRA